MIFKILDRAGIPVSDFRPVSEDGELDRGIQVSADIFERLFVRLQVGKADIPGAARLSRVGCGVFTSLQAGVEMMVKLEQAFEPDSRKQSLDVNFSKR